MTPADRTTIERICRDDLEDASLARGFDIAGGDGGKGEKLMTVRTDVMPEVLPALKPPEKLTLSAWAEANFVLASGSSSARPGRFRLWSFQREILDAIGDQSIEKVIIQKSVRVGLTKSTCCRDRCDSGDRSVLALFC